ncbi:MAG TPA: hypothetical protein VH083_06740, partial [Myxococcales bacterium]|nr:hypothetical protein [Myxococcales bacterium]
GGLSGTITYDTTSVRGIGLLGNTTRTPISGIHIDFDWSLGTESGKGTLASDGERRLTGTWGNGAARTGRGALSFSHA